MGPIASERCGRGNRTTLKERGFCLESQELTSTLGTGPLHKRQLVGRSEAATGWLFPRSGKGRARAAARGSCAALRAPGSIPGCRCSGCLSPGQHSPSPSPGLLRGRSRAGNEYLHPLEKRSSPPPRGRAEAGDEARYPSRMRMSPSRGSWLRCAQLLFY